jgi:hypothetical protein
MLEADSYAEIAHPGLVCRYGHQLETGSLQGSPAGKYVVTPQGVFQLPSRLDQTLETFTVEDGKLVYREQAGVKIDSTVILTARCIRCPSYWVAIFKRFYVESDYRVHPDGSFEVLHLDTVEHAKEMAGQEAYETLCSED